MRRKLINLIQQERDDAVANILIRIYHYLYYPEVYKRNRDDFGSLVRE